MTEERAVRLYLTVPPETDAARLCEALDAGDVACVLLRGASRDSAPLIRAAQEREVAALIPDDPDLAKALDADGVHLGPGGDVERVRKRLGDDRILGASCGASRHEAMIAGEAGADYVAFSGREDRPELAADPSILSWWQVMMTLPCVAMGRIDLGEVADLARAGADFVVLDEAVWAHPEGAAAAVAEADRQLARVERES